MRDVAVGGTPADDDLTGPSGLKRPALIVARPQSVGCAGEIEKPRVDRVRVAQNVERVMIAEPPHGALTIDVVDHLAPRCSEITQSAQQRRHVGDVLEAGVADDEVKGAREVWKFGNGVCVNSRSSGRTEDPIDWLRRS